MTSNLLLTKLYPPTVPKKWVQRPLLVKRMNDGLQPVAEGYFAGKFDRRGAALMLPGWLARFVPPLDFRFASDQRYPDAAGPGLQQADRLCRPGHEYRRLWPLRTRDRRLHLDPIRPGLPDMEPDACPQALPAWAVRTRRFWYTIVEQRHGFHPAPGVDIQHQAPAEGFEIDFRAETASQRPAVRRHPFPRGPGRYPGQ